MDKDLLGCVDLYSSPICGHTHEHDSNKSNRHLLMANYILHIDIKTHFVF